MQTFERPLLDAERRWLRRVTEPQRAAGRRLVRATVVTGLLVFGLLATLTLAFTNADWRVVVAFWVSVGVSIGLWMYFEERSRLNRSVRSFDRALALNKARVTRIQSSAVVEIEEEEDEGATYAFQVAEREIVFVSGQDFYPTARFPNTDYAIVELLGDADAVVGILIEKRGKKLAPLRKISPTKARRFARPKHLQVIEGSLNELEHLLADHSSLGIRSGS